MADKENFDSQSPAELPPLARFTGSSILAMAMFALAAVVAYGSFGFQNKYAWGFTALTVIAGAAFMIGRSQQERAAPDQFAKQRTLLGVNAVTSVLLVLVLIVGVNYVAGRRVKTFDLTKNKANSLSPQTLDVLGKLTKPVQLKLYFMQPDPNTQTLLDNYKRESDQIKVDYVNVLKNPIDIPQTFSGQPMLIASEVTAPTPGKPGIVSTPAGKQQEISQIDEQGITSALMKLRDSTPQPIYFLSGHGEVDPSQAAAAQEALKAQNYTVKTFSLFGRNAKIPADAVAVLVAGPITDLSAQDVKVLTAYIANKGRLILMGGIARDAEPNWTALLKACGLKWNNGYVIEPQTGQYAIGKRGDVTRHPILRGTVADVWLPAAQAYTSITPAPSGVTVTPIFESDPDSRQVTTASGSAGANGSFVLAAAVEKGNSRILVVGSSAITADQIFSRGGDRSFFLAGVNWVVGNDALVSIPPKAQANNTLDPPLPMARLFSIVSVLVLPVVALMVGAVVWFRRR